jgi:imidazole glycerol-phosphate synthase subunit HisH
VKAAVVDYRTGNLASVSKALERVGASATVSDRPAEMQDAEVLVLPGVGNFTAGMTNLGQLGLIDFIVSWAEEGRPLVGICLGMQVLFEHSEEGDTKGLGILPGEVVKIDAGGFGESVKVPHMGWNTVHSSTAEALRPSDGKYFYFDHSYICAPSQEAGTALTTYGGDFVSAVTRDNVVGVQFHPEKSGTDGLELLGRLVRGR